MIFTLLMTMTLRRMMLLVALAMVITGSHRNGRSLDDRGSLSCGLGFSGSRLSFTGGRGFSARGGSADLGPGSRFFAANAGETLGAGLTHTALAGLLFAGRLFTGRRGG